MEESEKMLWNPKIDGERRVRMFGMKRTATLPFTFSRICHEWKHSKIAQPYLDTLHVSRVEVLEIGGPPNSVLIEENSKMKGSSYCVNQHTRHDVHRISDAQRAAEWAIKRRPRVALGPVTATRKRFQDVAK